MKNKTLSSLLNLPSIKSVDIIAGLSIAGLLLPEAVAYSSIANLPPQAGIIGLLAGLFCFWIFGASRFAIVSATSSSAVVLVASTSSLAGDNMELRLSMSVALVLITGVFFIIAALAKLGNITDFIAKPVLRGFAFGLAIVIIIKQLGSILGIHSNHSNMLLYTHDLFSYMKDWNILSLCIASGALCSLFIFSRFKYVPGGLLVIGIGILAGLIFDFSAHNIHLVGNINLHLTKPSIPVFDRQEWLRLGELGLALAMILYSESYGSIRNFAIKHSDEVSPNRDLFALGISNLVSGLFQGMPVGAGYSGTSANETAGAISRWSGFTAFAVVLFIVFTLLPIIALTPEPILAAIVIHAVSHALNVSLFKSNFNWKRDRLVIIAAIIGVLIVGALDGLLIAITISLVMLLKRLSESKISLLGRLSQSHNFVDIKQYAEAKPVDGILIFRPWQPLFFANCERILNQARNIIINSKGNIHSVIISLEESPDIDSSTIESFSNFFSFIISQNKNLVIARLKQPVYDMLSQIVKPSTANQIFLRDLSVDDAVNLCEQKINCKSDSSILPTN